MTKVYLIRNGEGHYKIGRTKLSISERMAQLQVGSSSELEFVAEVLVDHASKVEAALHNRFKAYHVSGEWFDLPQDAVDSFVQTTLDIDRIFNTLIDAGNPFI